MNEIYGNSQYTSDSIILSRLLQENVSLKQGITVYGVLANFIGLHMEEIDKIAEYMGEYFSRCDIEKKICGTIRQEQSIGNYQ